MTIHVLSEYLCYFVTDFKNRELGSIQDRLTKKKSRGRKSHATILYGTYCTVNAENVSVGQKQHVLLVEITLCVCSLYMYSR
jgi:hypothetical protein